MSEVLDPIQRIIDVLSYSRLTSNAFAQKCGIAPSNLAKMIKGQQTITPKTLSKIEDAYPEISSIWLKNGEGEMLLDDAPRSSAKNIPMIDVEEADADTSRLIPFYDAETTGGFGSLVSSSTEDVYLQGYIDPGSWFGDNIDAAIRHVGDSMVEYPDGCILAVRKVRERRLLVPGRNYVVETQEYRVTKRIQKSETPGCITLYSSNPETYPDGHLVHEPFDVSFEDIRYIYSVVGYFVNEYGNIRLLKP